MEKSTITFISSRGRGMDPELKLIKDEIAASDLNPSFQYFIKQEVSTNKAYAAGIKAAKIDLLKHTDHIICMDMSLDVEASDMPDYGKKVLVQIPFNYLLEAAVEKQNNQLMPNKVGSAKFTHIYSLSPFGSELLKTTYEIQNVNIIEGFSSPVAYQIKDEEYQQAKRDELAYYYPESKGKKILAVLMSGKVKDWENWFLKDFDPEEFIKMFPEDWFIITDVLPFMELFKNIDGNRFKNFGYIPQLIMTKEAATFADIMITNEGNYLSYQAARRKPVYSMEFSNTNVEKYFRRNFPELYIDTKEQLQSLIDDAEEKKEIHQKACEFFSYEPEKKLTDHLIDLLCKDQ